jgi:prepilin-type N-terminal cleavage/methylation domain-containing protein/prepilin-type processing-associated H-X9-DG protein
MRSLPSKRRNGFTLIELLVVLVILAVLIGMFLPAWNRAKGKARRISCVGRLKNIGLAYRIFATDHNGSFPWALNPTNQHSTAIQGAFAWQHFVAVSNELSTPEIILCPADGIQPGTPADIPRVKAPNWLAFPRLAPTAAGNRFVSYFVGLDASEENPQTILGGDRNLSADVSAATPNLIRNGGATRGPLGPNGSFQILPAAANTFPVNAATRNFGFTTRTHDGSGNILLGDGSVQQVTSARFREAIRDSVSTTDSAIQWSLPN